MKNWQFYTLLIIFFVSCKNNPTPTEKTEAKSEPVEEIQEEPLDEILVQNIKMGEDSSSFRFLASYPETKYDFINKIEAQFAQDFLTKFKKISLQYQNDSINLEEGKHIDFYQNFDVLQKNNKVLALLISRSSTEDKGLSKKFFTHYFDLEKEKQLKTEDFFKDYNTLKKFAEVAKGIAQDSLRSIIAKNKKINKKDKDKVFDSINQLIIKETEPLVENYKNIIKLPNENWKFIFDEHNIIDEKDSEPFSIIIPENVMAVFLKPDFLTLMDSKIPEEEIEVAYNEDNIDCEKMPCVALTFDDGPSAYTPQLLDILKENNVKATFFILGKSAKIQKKTLQRAFEEGHEIENHTWDHKNLVKLTDEQIRKEVEKTDSILVELIGQKATYLRPPYGSFNRHVRSIVKKPYILWTVDPLDWKSRDTQLITKKLSAAEPGTILLAHDTHKETVDAIPQVIKNLKAKGYHFVTVKKLFEDKKLKNGEKYRQRK